MLFKNAYRKKIEENILDIIKKTEKMETTEEERRDSPLMHETYSLEAKLYRPNLWYFKELITQEAESENIFCRDTASIKLFVNSLYNITLVHAFFSENKKKLYVALPLNERNRISHENWYLFDPDPCEAKIRSEYQPPYRVREELFEKSLKIIKKYLEKDGGKAMNVMDGTFFEFSL